MTDYGWTYVLANPTKPGIVRVGMTTRRLDERVRDHNKMLGIEPGDRFDPAFAALGPKPGALERAVHVALDRKGLRLRLGGYGRTGSRELFRATVDETREVFARCLSAHPHEIVDGDWSHHEARLALDVEGAPIYARRERSRPPTLSGWMLANWDQAVDLMGDWSEGCCRDVVRAYDAAQKSSSLARLSLTPIGVRETFKRMRYVMEQEERRLIRKGMSTARAA